MVSHFFVGDSEITILNISGEPFFIAVKGEHNTVGGFPVFCRGKWKISGKEIEEFSKAVKDD